MHLFLGGMSIRRLYMAKIFGAVALRNVVPDFAEQQPKEELLVGYGANYTMFGDDVRIDFHTAMWSAPPEPDIWDIVN